MTDTKNLIAEYEETLKNPLADKVAPYYFRGADSHAELCTVTLIKYAIERILYFTPSEAVALITPDILNKLKLTPMINQYVRFPAGLPEDRKITYLVYLCYPKKVSFSMKEWYKEVFENVLKAPEKGKKNAFPKDFFTGKEGLNASCVCLQHVITTFLDVDSIEELYHMFGNPDIINPLLKKYRLAGACKTLHYNDPIEYLHYSLVDEQKDYFLFYFYEYKKQLELAKKIKKNSEE